MAVGIYILLDGGKTSDVEAPAYEDAIAVVLVAVLVELEAVAPEVA